MKKFSFPAIIMSFLLSIFSFQEIYSQTTSESIGPSSYEVQVIPASPDVADLGKFGTVPVNKYNGTANVSIPIHQIDFDGLSIPISLNYNTSGVRVNQDASWVGLGWSLNEGFTITRDINGFDDINSSGVDQKSNGWIYTEDYLVKPPYTLEISAADLVSLNNAANDNDPNDTEPDLFNVSLPGGSVRFYLPKILGSETFLVAKVISDGNYKVNYNIANKTFEVIDANGFTYDFTEKELSTGYGSWDANPTNSSELHALYGIPRWSTNQTRMMIKAWKISKITSPMGKVLDFGYQDGFFMSFPGFSQRFVFGPGFGGDSETNISTGSPVSVSLSAFHVKYLNTISGDFGSMIFNLGNRDDLFSKDSKQRLEAFISKSSGSTWNPSISPNTYNAKRLESIDIKDPNGAIVKEADFNYTYFNQNQVSHTAKERFIRLKLDSITVQDKVYSFDYSNPNALPGKDTKSIDFWGFYNGQTNVVRIPSHNRFLFNRSYTGAPHFESHVKLNGANRKSDINYGKYGILNKVTYPTGGSTEFVYEGNTVTLKQPRYTPSYYTNGDFKFSNVNASEDYNFRYQYLKLASDATYKFKDNSTVIPPAPDIYEEFEVGGARIQKIINKDSDGSVLSTKQYVYDEVIVNGTSSSSGKLMDDLVFASRTEYFEYTPENFISGHTIYSDNRIRSNPSASGSHIGYNTVTEYNSDGSNDNGKIVTRYTNIPNEYITRYIGVSYYELGYCGDCNITYDCIDSTGGLGLSAGTYCTGTTGNEVSYGEVYQMGAPNINYEHLNGSVADETVYDIADNKLSETTYDYQEITGPGSGFSFYPMMTRIAGQYFLMFPYKKVLISDLKNNKFSRLVSNTTRQFFDNDSITSTKDYFYQGAGHDRLTKTIITNSNGESHIAKAYYPQDVTSEPFMTDLIAENRLATPIITEAYINKGSTDILLNKQTTVYTDLHNVNSFVLPEKVTTQKGTSSGQERVLYEKYDTNGNLLQYRKSDGSPISFIWGYNGQYPIAKIENAIYSEFSSQVANLQSLSNLDNDRKIGTLGNEGALRAALTTLRNTSSLQDAMVTTYTYDPLIGVTSITNPKGYTIYYEYDAFNRLKQVKDADGKLLSENEYHYKNQQ